MKPRHALTTTCALLLCWTAAADAASFTPASEIAFDAGTSPEAVAVADFNSDGRQDLAITGYLQNRVFVRLGKGDGTFGEGAASVRVTRPEEIAVGDFDSDGTEDLAVSSDSAPNELVAYEGVGNGTFEPSGAIDLPGRANSIAVGDFNGDGREDLAAVGYRYASTRIGHDDGTFNTGVDLPLDGGVTSVVTGDFDGNGIEDLAVALNGRQPTLRIYPGEGGGDFGGVREAPLPNVPVALAAGDFNADGREDLAAAIAIESRVSVRLGNGDATLSDGPPDVPVGASPLSLAVGDFDSDGREDLATANFDGDSVSVRLGNGDGTFRADADVAVGNGPSSVALGDYDSDGKEDLAVANRDDSSVSVRRGVGPASLAGNLLVNGGFEEGPGARLPTQSPVVPGWQTAGRVTAVRYGAAPHLIWPSWLDSPRYLTGGFNFLRGGDSTGLGGITAASQVVDVSGSAAGIDAGRATVALSAFLGGALLYPDNMSARAEFLSEPGASLGALVVGPVTVEDRKGVTTLLRRAGSASAPAGTRRIWVTLTSTDNDTVSSASADNVKLTLAVEPEDAADPPPPPPPVGFGPDTRVSVTLARGRIGRKDPVRVAVSNANGFGVTGAVSASAKTVSKAGRRPVKLAARRFDVRAAGRATVTLALPRTLRRQLRRKHKLGLRLSAVAQDPAGNRRAVTNRVVLRLVKPRPA